MLYVLVYHIWLVSLWWLQGQQKLLANTTVYIIAPIIIYYTVRRLDPKCY